METRQMSLSKKLDGGFLHINKKKHSKNNKNSPSKQGFSNYLYRNNHTNNILGGGGDSLTGKQKDSLTGKQKVVSIQSHSRYKKRPSSKKKKLIKNIKDISESTILPKHVVNAKQRVNAKQIVNAKHVVNAKQRVNAKGIPIKLPTTNGTLKKRVTSRRSFSKKRAGYKSLTNKKKYDIKGKRISVSKVRNYSKKDISLIQQKLKNIKEKSTNDIQIELKNKGISLSGKSPEILKDIYMYSQLCGINIKRE